MIPELRASPRKATPARAALAPCILLALALLPAPAAHAQQSARHVEPHARQHAAQHETFATLADSALSQIDGALTVSGLDDDVEVIRDEWGVPHIYAQNRHDLFFAQGFVQAQDRLWQIDMWRRTNEGRLAEILGPDAFEHDRLARLLMFRGDNQSSWDDEFASYHPDGRAIFQAFADGVNAYIDQVADNLPVEYKLTGLTPLRWTPEASTGRVATALPLGDARDELRLAMQVARLGIDEVNRREAPGVANWIDLELPEGLDVALITDDVLDALGHFRSAPPRPPLLPQYQQWEDALGSENDGAHEDSPGSNNWVVSGRLTKSGSVLLANDPHRAVMNPSLRYLVHLNAPGYSVIGSTEPAIPGVAIGHNGRIGWGLTIVGTDQADVFVEQLNPRNLDEARHDGAWYPLRIVVDTIRVKGEAARVVRHRYSRHGPVFYVDSTNHVAYAIRSTSTEPGTAGYLAALRLAEVDDCHGFIDAMAYYHAPTENMMCGDVHGNIAWLAAALSPRRSGGWYGRLPVPGTGRYEWDGFRSHTELPQEFNPERGWIGTANNDIQPPGYHPPLMFKPGPSARMDRVAEMLSGDTEFTVDDFERMQNDAVHPWFASQDRPLFVGWTAGDPVVEWARAQIATWDGTYHRSSAAAVLHYFWRRQLSDSVRALSSSVARQRAAESALASAVDSVRARLGPDREEWRWGRIHRSELPHAFVGAYDLPAVERNGGGGTVAATGATFRFIVDFSDFDNSRVTNAPGQSGQPGSPFYGDLIPVWGNGGYFPLVWSVGAVGRTAMHRLEMRGSE